MNWKVVFILIVLIIGVFALSYTYGTKTKMAPAMRIKMEIEGNMSYAIIKNIDASLINLSVAEVQKGDDSLRFPTVALNVIENMRPISYYRYIAYNGSGVYEADIGLLEPPKGNKVRIIVEIYPNSYTTLMGIKTDIILNQTQNISTIK